jgi:hypothetical protein
MPPLLSYTTVGVVNDDNNNNNNNNNYRNDQESSSSSSSLLVISGFTSNLLESITSSKARMGGWVEQEKGKADTAAVSYQKRLMEEQTMIDAMAADLLAVQLERGMKIEDIAIRGRSGDSADHDDDDQRTNNNNNNYNNNNNNNNSDNIAAKKLVLEQQITQIQIEVMKLQTERDNRDRRVKGKRGCQGKVTVVDVPANIVVGAVRQFIDNFSAILCSSFCSNIRHCYRGIQTSYTSTRCPCIERTSRGSEENNGRRLNTGSRQLQVSWFRF